jgi:vesicle-associated membrane protein 7
MPIIYGVVARGSTVLAEYSTAKGNFDEVAKKILEKISSQHNSKMSYVYERYMFIVITMLL